MPLGTTLLADRYRTIERVGSGGMATVLLAEDERLGRQVAVKLLHAESPEDTARRFGREARLGASLNHPNLVSIYDIATDDEGVLIVMEYVEGETLRDAIERGPLLPSRALAVLRDVAAALDHAHSEGIVHRDVKPANVLLGADGRTVKLADLGIATAIEGTRITMSGTVLGTAAYMAPEQLEGRRAGPAADVYSLAVVAWEALSGRRAYDGRSPLEIAHRKAAEPPPSLASVRPETPPAADAVLARAMGADPLARPVTAGALVDELEKALQPAREPVAARRPAATPSAVAKPAQPRPTPAAAPPAPHAPRVAVAQPAQRRPAPAATPAPRIARSRGRFLPLAALVAVAAVAVAAVLASSGGGGSTGKPAPKHATASAPKKHRATSSSTPPPTAGAAQPAAPAPSPAQAPSTSSYQLPTPAGTSAAEGARLNAQGKQQSDAGNYPAAVATLERAVRAFPAGTTAAGNLQYAYALFNLGHALLQAGRPADAIPVLEERLKNPDQRGTVESELATARQQAGQR